MPLTLKHFFVIGLVLLTASCVAEPEPPLRVATNVWPGYESLYLARSLGLYDKSPIRLIEMNSASEVSHALRHGAVEVAAVTLDEALTLMQDGMDLRVVLVMDVSNGADVVLARPEIISLKGLKGKRVGVEEGAVGAVMLDAALRAAALSSTDIHLVPLTVDEHLAAWRDKKVDALVTFEPVRTELMQQGAVDVFNSSQVPGRIVDVLVVRASLIAQHRNALKKLISGHFSALNVLATRPQEAATRMAPRLAIEPTLVLKQFGLLKLPDLKQNQAWLGGSAPTISATARALSDLMLQDHLLHRSVDVSGLAEPALLPAPNR